MVFVRSGDTLHQQFGTYTSVRYTTWRRRRREEPPEPLWRTRRRRRRHPSSDGVSVDALVDGQLEVNLLDLGVSAEDIAAMRRIDASIEEARRAQQQALEAEL